MVDSLEIPEALAGAGVKGEQAVGEKIVTDAVSTVKIKSCRAGGNKDDSTNGIERHASPVVGGAAGFPGVRRPGFEAEFTGMRNGVKRPAEFSGADVEGADAAGRSWKGFRIATADDDQIFEDQTGTGEGNRVGAGRLASEIFAEIDAAGGAKISNRFAGGGVERVKKIHYAYEDAGGGSGTPVGQAAIGLRAVDAGIEFPEKFAGGGVQREDFLRRSDAVENAVDDQGIGLETARFGGVKGPRNLELGDVGAIDLCERGEMIAFGSAAIAGPVLRWGWWWILLSERGVRENEWKESEASGTEE